MDEKELKERTKRFALETIKLVGQLPRTVVAQTIGRQFVRAGTSVGANYRSACRGRSRAEFAAKLGVVEEEADESAFWMEVIIEAGLLERALVQPLLDEAEEIVAIMVSSRKSLNRTDKLESRV
jgi:four helix bundle protein